MAAALVYWPENESAEPLPGKAARYIGQVAGYGSQVSVLNEHSPCPKDWKRGGEMKLYLPESSASFSLRAEFQGTQGQSGLCSIEAEVKPALEFRERFHNLTADYFDDILIAASTGEVLFESNVSGLRISNIDTLVSMQPSGGSKPEGDGKDVKGRPSPFRDISQFSNVREVKFAGSASSFSTFSRCRSSSSPRQRQTALQDRHLRPVAHRPAAIRAGLHTLCHLDLGHPRSPCGIRVVVAVAQGGLHEPHRAAQAHPCVLPDLVGAVRDGGSDHAGAQWGLHVAA